jgi:hypothetical protein
MKFRCHTGFKVSVFCLIFTHKQTEMSHLKRSAYGYKMLTTSVVVTIRATGLHMLVISWNNAAILIKIQIACKWV